MHPRKTQKTQFNSAGTVATWAVNAWTLIDHDLSLELDKQAAAILGAPRTFGYASM